MFGLKKYIPGILVSTSRAVRDTNTRLKASQEFNIKDPAATASHEAGNRSMGN